MNNLGKRIKELRKKNDLTQEKLADFLGVTYKAVSKWECGLTTPDISLIVPMARLFNVTTDEILGMQSSEADERKRYFDAEYDLAVTELRKAIKYTAKGDLAMKSGKQFYTSPILDHYEYDRSDSRPLEESYTEYLKNKLSTEQQYDVIRDREDFQALFK